MKWFTHEVENQVPELGEYNVYASDIALQEGVRREGALEHEPFLHDFGAWLGSAQAAALGREANVNVPVAELFDRHGYRIDKVRYHPAWHMLMHHAVGQGMHCSAHGTTPGRNVARAARYLMHGQIEAGTLCPLTMTSAAIPLIQREGLYDGLRPLLFSTEYDASDTPLTEKRSMLIGMGMTEKQGGSDLRSISTRALPTGKGGRGSEYALIGHKWFYSVPTSDAHLVLARHEEQYSCFYVPRWQPDGTLNRIHIQRLKDKLGNRSNASAEVEFVEAYAVLIGEPGRGIATLVEMAAHTRLDCVLGSAALMRQSLVQALHHTLHRRAFGKRLADQPLMRSVLADLALESEAATTLSLRLARSFEEASPLDLAFRRILTPAAKYWACKRAVGLAAECMEVWGGNGYIEDGPMPRLLRESPVNAIWEGSGNVMCLDVLRALRREPDLAGCLLDALIAQSADDPLLSQRAEQLATLVATDDTTLQAAARHIAQSMVLLVQADLLRRHAPTEVAEAFVASRFGGHTMALYGASSQAHIAGTMIKRAWYE